jgi:hypothetical protein
VRGDTRAFPEYNRVGQRIDRHADLPRWNFSLMHQLPHGICHRALAAFELMPSPVCSNDAKVFADLRPPETQSYVGLVTQVNQWHYEFSGLVVEPQSRVISAESSFELTDEVHSRRSRL